MVYRKKWECLVRVGGCLHAFRCLYIIPHIYIYLSVKLHHFITSSPGFIIYTNHIWARRVTCFSKSVTWAADILALISRHSGTDQQDILALISLNLMHTCKPALFLLLLVCMFVLFCLISCKNFKTHKGIYKGNRYKRILDSILLQFHAFLCIIGPYHWTINKTVLPL